MNDISIEDKNSDGVDELVISGKWYASGSGGHRLYVSGSTTGPKVGIGTTSPGATLQVDSPYAYNAAATSLGTSRTKAHTVLVGNTGNGGGIAISNNNGASDSILQGVNAAGDTAYNILLNPFAAKVGIGQTSPGGQLEVKNTGTGKGTMLNQDGNGTALWIDTEATTGGHGIYFDAPTLTTGHAIVIADWAAATTGAALKVQLNGTALATTAASGVIDVSSTGDTDSNVNNLLYLNNDYHFCNMDLF